MVGGECVGGNLLGMIDGRKVDGGNRFADRTGFAGIAGAGNIHGYVEQSRGSAKLSAFGLLQQIRSQVGQLLTPIRDEFWDQRHPLCPTCGQAVKGEGNPLGLCTSCFAAIPWITEVLCPVCGRGITCPDCLRGYQRNYRVNRSAVQYNDAMREWLARFKYRGDQQLAPLFGRMLYHGYRHLTDVLQRPVLDAFDCLTYVPVSSERLAERGFNQAEEMAVALSRHVNLPIVPLLSRVKATSKQSQKSRTARFLDMHGAFALDAAGRPGLEQAVAMRHARLAQQGKEPAAVVPQILLIDDVYTTGSTVDQCAATLRGELPAAEICTLTWAR